jgi:acyl-CoA thioester hydrolase
MPRDEFTFAYPLRVRWAEVDRQGVVFNPQYFAYFDVAVTEYWRALSIRYPEDFSKNGTDTFAVSARAEFHGSAAYDDLVELCCRVGRIGRTSMQFLFGVHRGDVCLTSGEIVYVNVLLDTRRPEPWSDALRDTIVRFEKTRPEVPLGAP